MLVEDGGKATLISIAKNMPLFWIYFWAFPFWERINNGKQADWIEAGRIVALPIRPVSP
jgi:hypothetical protein